MGKKLDALLRRNFKISKFKALVNLAISRLAIFKNQRQVRSSHARSDVIQLLNLGHHDRALLRVEHVIKEQNMLDVFVMIEGYCLLLIERVSLIEQEKLCPEELKEAISSLLHASSRCGDFPELQEIRAVFTSRYGKEFAARSIELRNNCGVNPKMIQKLSTRQPSLENRMKVLREIASENSIILQLEEPSSVNTEELDMKQEQNQHKLDPPANSGGDHSREGLQVLPEEIEKDQQFSNSMKTRKYKDVADAAQAAFESAAYAAAAARAAVELSRSEPHDPDDQNSLNNFTGGKLYDSDDHMESKNGKYCSESEDDNLPNENQTHEFKQSTDATGMKMSMSASSSDSEDTVKASKMSSDELDQTKTLGKEVVFYESDDENGNKISSVDNSTSDEDLSEETRAKAPHSSHKQFPLRFQADLKVESERRELMPHSTKGSGIQSAQGLKIEKRPFSVRTRR